MKVKKIDRLNIIVFMLLFCNSSFLVTNNMISSFMTVILWVFTFGLIAISIRKISLVKFNVALLIVLFLLTPIFINNEPAYQNLTYVFSFLTAFVFVSVYDYTEFCKSYVNVMFFLALFSLVLLLLCVIFPQFEAFFTLISPGNGKEYAFFLLFAKNRESIRNCGMFWEPGAFQTFLNLALLFEAFSDNPNKKKLYVFIIAILSTFSTTGYIAMAEIALIILTARKSFAKRLRKSVFASMILGIIFFIIVMIYRSDILLNVFGKIQKFVNNDFANGTSSAAIRFYSIVKPIEVFKSNYFWGVGYQGLKEKIYSFTYGVNTCTFVNWFAMYGMIYGSLMLLGFIKFSVNFAKKRCNPILVLMFLLTIIISENYTTVAIFYIIALYGYEKINTFCKKGHSFNIPLNMNSNDRILNCK